MYWLAKYVDGHAVKEGECSYANLERDGITRFSLCTENEELASVEVKRGRRFFYRIRTFNATMPSQFRVWILGWKSKTELHFILLHDNGIKEEYSQWGTTPLTLEPQWLPSEKV